MKILAVDDAEIQLRILKSVLESAGHEVVEANDGQVAWEMLQDEHYRLVITDWMMPRLTGPELIQRIRAANWASYTYIILLTSQDAKSQMIEGLNAGADDYLIKPFDPAELIARLGIAQRILDLEARLADMARQDLLTGLFNRRALYEILQAALSQAGREASPLSLILIDLDHFKSVNDHYGHPMGDLVLQRVAETLRTNKRRYDSVGRWGGEEFLVILPNTDMNAGVIVAERLRAGIASTPLSIAQTDNLALSASLGVTSTERTDSSHSLDLLLKQADQALYQAKSQGRNCVCVFKE
jgi:two-component system chemotaxis response regulator CheY